MFGVELPPPEEVPTAEIWPGQETALAVFMHCCNQWRTVVGQVSVFYQGIDRIAVKAVMDMMGIPAEDQHETLNKLRCIEAGALELLNKR
ncbi:DUF1799 domain-containing protein [Carnimonas bestiolae]|uniref:DUF1799 domain-containing protein n=1 Tax=Carnimonas bestiolae TaxID=3402172 RepID=UPI003EDBCBFB